MDSLALVLILLVILAVPVGLVIWIVNRIFPRR